MKRPFSLLAGFASVALIGMACADDKPATPDAGKAAHTEPSKPAEAPAATEVAPAPAITAIPFKDMEGKEHTLAEYAGKVVLLVNTASKCGLTPQYEDLEETFQEFSEKGFVVIAFPANNFMGQEPGTDAEIKEFCTTRFNVTFPVMSKLSVKGDDKAPLYKALTEEGSPFPGEIGWNFEKFLISRDGKVIARFKPKVKPGDPEVRAAIEAALAQPAG